MIHQIRKHYRFILITLLLLFGLWYRLLLTSQGNFIFNMDNARDMLDVREMVVLGKMRLIGPTSGIEGFFNGPFWYYILAIPFIISSGNPYASVLLMILFWVIGGYFLLKIVSRWGVIAILVSGSLWIASNYVVLSTLYAYNPNPVLLLSPLFIFLFEKYLISGKLLLGVGAGILAGLFFNFEMAYGVFMPLILALGVFLTWGYKTIQTKKFWLPLTAFTAFLIPQLLFELRYKFFMTQSVLHQLSQTMSQGQSSNPIARIEVIGNLYLNVFSGTLMNMRILVTGASILLIFIFLRLFIKKYGFKDKAILISCLLIIVPFLGQIILPVNVMLWHLGGAIASLILLLGFAVFQLKQINGAFKLVALCITFIVVVFAFNNLELRKNIFDRKDSMDPSAYRNEIAAIDYAYQSAQGKNFKVYTYLPSVYDYPYQYLFWWYGQRKYGYLPKEYAYAPQKPAYIKNKDKFNNNVNPDYSNKIFLIEEPDASQWFGLWKNNYSSFNMIGKNQVGPLMVEVLEDSF